MIIKRKKEKAKTIVREVGHGYKNIMKDSIHGLFDFKQ